MALGYTSVRIWQSRIIGKTAGGERLKITAARIRLRHIISDKPITPEICGKMLISHHIRSEYKKRGPYFFTGLQICFQPVDRGCGIGRHVTDRWKGGLPRSRPTNGEHRASVTVFQIEVRKIDVRRPSRVRRKLCRSLVQIDAVRAILVDVQ